MAGDDVAIRVEHVSKKYCKSLRRSMVYGMKDIGRNLVGLSSHPEKLRDNEFWAVDDVSFELRKGEALGLIGPNGSGKSTLLKMLKGIFWADKGKITVKGRVGALIEVGAGFHPLLTGRENVYVNGAILGMTKLETEAKFDDIVDFADIGDFIDAPVKSYSSGMYVRLGFAVAVHCEPDILLIDEVLAVGDRDFQMKCLRKMHELKKEGDGAIILVTHNEKIMRKWAQKCVVLDHGSLLFDGESENAISFYINKILRDKDTANDLQGGVGKGIVKRVVFRNSKNEEVNRILTGDKLIIDLQYETERRIKNPIFGISYYNNIGLFTGFWNSFENVRLPDVFGKGTVRITVDRFDLPVDNYSCIVVVCEEEESNMIEWKSTENTLTVERPNNTNGLIKLPHKWEVLKYPSFES